MTALPDRGAALTAPAALGLSATTGKPATATTGLGWRAMTETPATDTIIDEATPDATVDVASETPAERQALGWTEGPAATRSAQPMHHQEPARARHDRTARSQRRADGAGKPGLVRHDREAGLRHRGARLEGND
jgi:hypothetical protein